MVSVPSSFFLMMEGSSFHVLLRVAPPRSPSTRLKPPALGRGAAMEGSSFILHLLLHVLRQVWAAVPGAVSCQCLESHARRNMMSMFSSSSLWDLLIYLLTYFDTLPFTGLQFQTCYVWSVLLMLNICSVFLFCWPWNRHFPAPALCFLPVRCELFVACAKLVPIIRFPILCMVLLSHLLSPLLKVSPVILGLYFSTLHPYVRVINISFYTDRLVNTIICKNMIVPYHDKQK